MLHLGTRATGTDKLPAERRFDEREALEAIAKFNADHPDVVSIRPKDRPTTR